MASWDGKLITAAKVGNIEEVELCVKNRANLECRDGDWGQTPLMLAAEKGHMEVVTYLVTHGSQLDATSKYGETALHLAAEFGRIDVTKCLIDQGCSPWVKSLEGRTPYDLVNIYSFDDEEEKRKKEEVMDFLKTVMSKTSPEVTPDTHLQEPAALLVEGNYLM
ncbi:ankyrin repeat domain-containing protein 2-like [Mytilus trossulus]|uniref:ankyrin repeat domain-containing protein 2-like n=1 Tax=Mytilus trossulus TaxID=6551 RepID=UPI003006B6C8